ncbi:ATP synthase F0 sector subunit b [hydrothermal vent metagenome]|uniref:ATP synthase F0 sector subunit b n=1 Tax=hydrothermal vent metagenome TaxID=652676 RepID=A0A1W1E718_9ZZZZ
MKKVILLSLIVLPAVLLASSGHGEEASRYFAQTGRESDYWPRVINFTIFAALLWYLLANPIKDFFNGRSSQIASQLKEIEEKLQAAKDEKKEAQVRLDESVKKAEQIIEDARKEAVVLAQKIAEANTQELEAMQKQFDEKVAFEERRASREAIDEVLSENITVDDIMLEESKIVDIISRKVA